MTEPLYHRSGRVFAPTELTTGPWYPGTQHGGPPAALLAWGAENEPGAAELSTVRLTVELLRPVPLAPLELRTEVLRPGRRVRLVQASLHGDGKDVARAIALQLRPADHPVPEGPSPIDTVVPPDEGDPLVPAREHPPAYHRDAVDIRFTRGSFTTPGPGFAWIRLLGPVVDDAEPTALQRVAAAADFGNGVSAFLHPKEWFYVNPDLTIYVDRTPIGQWIGLEAHSRGHRTGIGLAESLLHDRDGPFGRSLQALLIWPRGE